MEYANDEIFNIRYDEKNDCLKINKEKSFVKRHKVMSLTIMTTFILIGVNSFMIYEFFSLLSTL